MGSNPAWKKRERQVAGFFGCKRNILSGTASRPDLLSASDSTDRDLFIETKAHKSHAARSLWEKTRPLARKEAKLPVLALADNGKPGFLVVVHSDDLVAFCRIVAARAAVADTLELQADAVLDEAVGGPISDDDVAE